MIISELERLYMLKNDLKDSHINDTDLLIECNSKNASHGKILSVCVIGVELVFLIIALLVDYSGARQDFDYHAYIGMYIVLIFISLSYHILLKKYDEENGDSIYQKRYYYITVVFAYLLIVWGMIVSFLDQGLYSNLNALFINLIAVASFFYIRSRESIFLFSSVAIVFMSSIGFFQKDIDILTGHYVNSAVIFVFMGLSSYLSYNVFVSDYLHRRQLQDQIIINHEINEQLNKAVTRLEAMVIEDSLTSLPNRRGLERFIENVEKVYEADQELMTIMMIDIDHFKQYNDYYGHIQGDHALVSVSEVLKAYIMSLSDYMIRFGGEEFLFISIGRNTDTAIELAEKIRQEIEDLEIQNDGTPENNKVTVSIGVINTEVGNSEWINEQILLADKALYQAKEKGRNQVFVGS